MIALRHLSVFYLAAASSFAVAIALSQHPTWNQAAHDAAQVAGEQGARAAVALNETVVRPGWALTKTASATFFQMAASEFNMLPVETASRTVKKPVVVAQKKPQAKKPPVVIAYGQARNPIVVPQAPALRPQETESAPLKPQHDTVIASAPQIAPQAVSPPSPQQHETVVATVTPKYSLAPSVTKPLAPQANAQVTPPPVNDRPPSAAELARVTQHLRASLTKEMLANFELFLYVSKADHGFAAQRMYVFQKQNSGDLALLYNWPVSTGRELDEIAPNGQHEPTITPAGYYELDAKRMYVSHFSGQWHQPMPYAMFFNWEKNGLQTGLAIHGASGKDIALLGERASAGCIHLAPEHAQALFTLIRTNYKGLMPKFAYDKRTATMSNEGVLVHTRDGSLEMTQGYKVLVFIENYGGENVVAALF